MFERAFDLNGCIHVSSSAHTVCVTTQLDFGHSFGNFELFKASDKEVQMFRAIIKLYFTYIKDNKYQA